VIELRLNAQNGPTLHYLDEVRVNFTLSSRCNNNVVISEMIFQLPLRTSLLEQESSTSPFASKAHMEEHLLKAQSTVRGSVILRARLGLAMYTNSLDATIRFHEVSEGAMVERTESHHAGYIIVTKREARARVFISFKDPEDRLLADASKEIFERAGVTAMLAREDRSYDRLIWAEKIPRLISECDGLFVIWSRAAAENPANILREIKIARDAGIRVCLLKENGVPVPDGWEADREYEPYDPNDTASVFAVIENMARMVQGMI
jgi:hypothetical protein